MLGLGRLFSSFRDLYKELNPATLTGAVDVIVVEQPDGSFVCSPFYVRFGKMGVIRSREKLVDITINDEPVILHMKLGDTGEAFFVEDTVEEHELPAHLATSPLILSNSSELMATGLANLKKQSISPSSSNVIATTTPSPTSLSPHGSSVDPDKTPTVESVQQNERFAKECGLPPQILTGAPPSAERRNFKKMTRLRRENQILRQRATHMRSASWTSGSLPNLNAQINLTPAATEQIPVSGKKTKVVAPPEQRKFRLSKSFVAQRQFCFNNHDDGDIDEKQKSNDGSSDDVKESETVHKQQDDIFHLDVSDDEINDMNKLDLELTPVGCPKEIAAAVNAIATNSDGQQAQNVVFDLEDAFPITSGEETSRPSSPRQKQEKVAIAIEEGKALGKVLNEVSNPDADWKWDKDLPIVSPEVSGTDGKSPTSTQSTGWGLSNMLGLGFMRRSAADSSKSPNPAIDGIYLNDLMKSGNELDPELAALYLANKRQDKRGVDTSKEKVALVSDSGPDSGQHSPRFGLDDVGYASTSAHSSIIATDDHRRWFFTEGRFQELLGDTAMSLCGGSKQDGSPIIINDELFKIHEITFDQFNSNSDILFSPTLIVRWNGKYYNHQVGLPILVSVLVYQQPLSETAINILLAKYQPKPIESCKPPLILHSNGQENGETQKPLVEPQQSTYSSWFSWRRGASMEPSGLQKSESEKNVADIEQRPRAASFGMEKDELNMDLPHLVDAKDIIPEYDERGAMSDSELMQPFNRPTTSSRYRKSLYLNSEQIKLLKLKPNQANRATFSVTTKYQGTTACECEIYLWRWDDKVVISDIDGTITKSDVLGHIMPIVGRQWEHSNVVELFNRVVDNGYRVIYLTARAIGQSQWTKDYLKSIRQNDAALPPGPLQLSPTSLFSALHREVIEKKPEIFKTKCLRDIKALFPEITNPFYAGFGNKSTDEIAYRASGVPVNRIFTINPYGEVRFADKNLLSSYQHISDLVDHIFPPLPTYRKVSSRIVSGAKSSPALSTTSTSSSSTTASSVDGHSAEEYSAFNYWRQPIADARIDVSKFAPERQKATRKESTSEKKKK